MPPKEAGVEQHADGDEEQAQQHVAERPYHRFHLMPEFGFRQHHTSEKGAQGERQADDLGGPRRTKYYEQHAKDKELRRARVGNFMK